MRKTKDMKSSPFTKILAISPHTDDIELSAGASLYKFATEGVSLWYVAFSSCSDTLSNTPFNKDTLYKECKKALKTIGIPNSHIFIFNHTNKHFAQESRSIFEKLDELKNSIHPDLVLIPDLDDTHQDHQTVSRQAISVFRRKTSILAYEQPWNSLSFIPNFYIGLSDKAMTTKMKALHQYKTQLYFKRPYFTDEFIYGLATTRGSQIMERYAEAFRAIKLIV